MPTYAYTCKSCGLKSEFSQKITEEPRKTCPHCSCDALQRGPGGGVGLSFTGSGFYGTDYKPSTPATDKSSTTSSSSCCPCGKNACG